MISADRRRSYKSALSEFLPGSRLSQSHVALPEVLLLELTRSKLFNNMLKTIARFKNKKAMTAGAITLFRAVYAKALAERGFMSAALSGGKTPLVFFKALAVEKGLDWGRIFFFFSDERLVRHDSRDSNYKAAGDLFFSKVQVPALNIFAVPVSKGAGAAAAYEKTIRCFFKARKVSFDLVLLGLGTEGHTASLFPGGPALREKKRLAVSVLAPAYARPRRRVTLTLKTLNSAKAVIFLVSGPEKKEVFESLAKAKKNLPASKIKPAENLYLFYSK